MRPLLNGLSLRAAGAADNTFLLNLFHRNRAAELMLFGFSAEQELQFVQMQFRARSFHYAQAYPSSQDHIVQRDGVDVGRLLLEKCADVITLIDIALLPEHCGHGLGTQLLRDLIAEADRDGSAIELHVEQASRAKKLYLQLGFAETQALPPYDAMVRQPQLQRTT